MLNRYEMETILRNSYYTVLEILGIEDDTEPELVIADGLKDRYVTGYYSKTRNIVVVNTQDLNNETRDIKDIIKTVCHELRHTWQERRYKDYYVRTYEELDMDDFDEYWNCEFEIDAREFAENNYEKVYNTVLENCSYLFD